MYKSLMFLILLSSSSILAFQYSLFFVLEMSTSFTSYRLSTLLWYGSCNQCILACFLWSKNRNYSASNPGLCCFHSYWPRLFLTEVLITSLMFSQALFMSWLSLKLFQSCTPVWDLILTQFPYPTCALRKYSVTHLRRSENCIHHTPQPYITYKINLTILRTPTYICYKSVSFLADLLEDSRDHSTRSIRQSLYLNWPLSGLHQYCINNPRRSIISLKIKENIL